MGKRSVGYIHAEDPAQNEAYNCWETYRGVSLLATSRLPYARTSVGSSTPSGGSSTISSNTSEWTYTPTRLVRLREPDMRVDK